MMHSLFLVAHAVTISTAIPGSNLNSTSTAPGAYIANFYQFALLIGGILAFGAIVFGGSSMWLPQAILPRKAMERNGSGEPLSDCCSLPEPI